MRAILVMAGLLNKSQPLLFPPQRHALARGKFDAQIDDEVGFEFVTRVHRPTRLHESKVLIHFRDTHDGNAKVEVNSRTQAEAYPETVE